MALLSYEFALFFALFFIVYWACIEHPNVQNALLLCAGLGFLLSWQWLFVVSIVFVWLVSQWATYAFNQNLRADRRKFLLIIALTLLVGHLCFFKYSNFIIEQLNQARATGLNLTPLDIVMPLGVSFYTFQAISYVVDVYHKKIEPMPSTVLLGFLSFVPTLTAGPIFRASDAREQWVLTAQSSTAFTKTATINSVSNDALIAEETNNPSSTATSTTAPIAKPHRYVIAPYLALALIVLALFKKLVLASWLETLWVTPVFANPLQFHGLEVLTAIYAYSLQLFFDFSGYTDLVLALALLLGFRLPDNFRRPYLATDIQDFWQKWHITLSTWIRDYIYIPLGGGRRAFWRVQLNLMLAFIISGVWHGAGWNFFIWGAIHGFALVFLNVLKRTGQRFWLTNHVKPIAIFLTFHYVAFGWVFFRSVTFEQAIQVLQALGNIDNIPFSLAVVPTLALMLAAWLVYPTFGQLREQLASTFARLPWWLLPILIALYVVILFSLAPDGLPGFIYANF